ncbi:proton-translocating NADH-quinone oxidoreductase, chain N [Catenulispora acidiphila DSM 44928]|uniref:NADH-quinone oxidoreductase subunit N n=1 Tax=Catenulispora acidiphila (strain DSM 44928 / JCM 14897 / NBRC 102108 / NRRL B-24433 / ID139908) TaxID=479433 RepID=C7QCN9_CATAD|nr:NADH-quinone oxidoreductase subunit NuoN [Catenulispora acidiphila]ACU76502.1 proton-translocating NADH-quinone oxidoreductase, chain N [Catenulispora acidiphila DSM 44928]
MSVLSTLLAAAPGAPATPGGLTTTANTFTAPHVEYRALMPMLVVFGAATIGILIEAFLPRTRRYWPQVAVSLAGVLVALGFVIANHGMAETTAADAVSVDGVTLFLQGTILALALLALLLVAERGTPVVDLDAFTAQGATAPGSGGERAADTAGLRTTEVFPLMLFSVGGMLLFPAANDLLTSFVALEVLSLPLYLLCGLARRRRLLSQEAAMKYFLLGAFSSAFFLYGIAMLYGYSGSVRLSDIATSITAAPHSDVLVLIGIALLAVGLLFKIGAVPFHAWTPDVYQGAPTPITAFMAAATKVAAFGALLRIAYVALPGMRWDWRPVMWGVAVLTMLAGAILAITQRDIKRMLAYSAILNAGYILLGVISTTTKGVSATLFYLAAYGFATVGAFAVVTLVRESVRGGSDSGEGGEDDSVTIGGEATDLSAWAGLGKRSPLLAACFTVFLLAFAGIPLTSGFTGKFALFTAAIDGGAWPLVIVGVIASAAAAFFYVRVIVLMYFSEPLRDEVSGPVVVVPSPMTTIALTVSVALTIALGVLPQIALDLANKAAYFVQ